MLATKPLGLLTGACFATCVAAGAGDDFSNNLFSDLAPLLALFGERVTTQFMSQSMGWADNIILAMAPLGIITAIVGAIRVGGPSWLKALIGRARENRAVAESELMSSTSHEVCELWNGQQIVRVMGSGPIREFIILLPKGNGDSGRNANAQTTTQTQTHTSGRGSGSVSSQVTGPKMDQGTLVTELEMDQETLVMELERAKKQKHLEDCHLTIRERVFGSFTQHADPPKAKEVPEGEEAEEVHQPGLAPQPKPTIRERILGRFTQHLDPSKAKKVPEGEEAREIQQPRLASQPKPTIRDYIFCRRIIPPQERDSEKAQPELDTHKVPHDSEVQSKDRPPVVIIRNTGVDTPNLTLNVHNQVGRGELYIVAAFGLVLQLGVLIYFGIAAKYLTLTLLKDGSPVADYAFPCTVAGMLLLAAGILLCAYVVDSSTAETRYRPADGMEVRVVWLQRAGTVNDQAFEPFAVFPDGPQALVTTSQRASRRKLRDLWPTNIVQEVTEMSQQPTRQLGKAEKPEQITPEQPIKSALERLLEIEAEEFIAVTGTMLGICGFVVQFIGLRGMHWSASVAQLGATVVMTILRASVRRNLAKNPKSQPLISGHEMDWLAMTLGDPENAPWRNPSKYAGKPDKYGRPWADNGCWDWRMAAVEDPAKCKELKRLSDTGDTKTKGLKEPLQADERNSAIQGKSSRSHARRVMRIRRDLGELADWLGPASVEAISLARAIEATMDALFGPNYVGEAFTWSLKTLRSPGGSNGESIAFHIKRHDGKWKAYSDEIDAALSLWLYSVYERENKEIQKETREKDGGESPRDDAWLRAKGAPAKPSLRLLGPHTAALLQNLQWWMPDGASKVIEVAPESENSSSIMKVESHRVVGFASEPNSRSPAKPGPYLYKRKSPELPCEGVPLAAESYSPLQTLYAQHMFSAFMWAAAMAMQPVSSKADIRPSETDGPSGPLKWQSFTLHDTQLSKMARDIQSTGLGNLEDVYLSIIPPLSAEKKLPRVDAIIEWARKQARLHEQLGHWSKAADAYLWLFRKAKTFSGQDDITIKATALLMEYLRAVTGAVKQRKAQRFEEKDIQELEKLKSKLDKELQSASVDIRVALVRLYKEQGRSWEYDLAQAASDAEDAIKTLGYTELHRMARDDRHSYDIEREMQANNWGGDENDILDWTPLHYAAANSSLKALQTLLEFRADANARDIRGRTPLHYACQHDDISIIQYLLREGAEINSRDVEGVAPLHEAVIHGQSSIMRSLIEAGANIDVVDSLGNSPLHWAAYRGRKALVELLEGANIKLRDHNGRTVLHLAAMAEEGAAMEGHKAVVKYLIEEAKADNEAKDRMGQTPLHLAAAEGHKAVVKYLIEEAKADKEAEDSWGEMPLHLAAQDGRGADKEAKDRMDQTPLHLAARGGHEAVVKYLIEEAKADNEAEVRIVSETPLHLAAQGGHEAVVKYLIEEAKADKEAKDRMMGQTPLHLAAQGGHEAVVEYLKHSSTLLDVAA